MLASLALSNLVKPQGCFQHPSCSHVRIVLFIRLGAHLSMSDASGRAAVVLWTIIGQVRHRTGKRANPTTRESQATAAPHRRHRCRTWADAASGRQRERGRARRGRDDATRQTNPKSKASNKRDKNETTTETRAKKAVLVVFLRK